jgi:hypothetical protein
LVTDPQPAVAEAGGNVAALSSAKRAEIRAIGSCALRRAVAPRNGAAASEFSPQGVELPGESLMRNVSILLAGALALWPALAAAQAAAPPAEAAPQQPAPSAAAAPEKAATGAAANTAATTPGLAVGQSVKDNTGAVIGQITDLKTDTDGKQVAVVNMGGEAFSVETDRLAVQNGAAAINATQAQLRAMIRRR